MKDSLELLAAAVAFAEAGDQDTARKMVDGLEAMRRSRRMKMLLVATDSPLAGCVIDYAVSLAGRLRYDIVALNIFQEAKRGLAARLGRLAGGSDHIEQAIDSYGLLKERARPMNIDCAHIVACGNRRTLVEETYHTIKGVEFAIVQQAGNRKDHQDYALPVYLVEC